MGHVSGLSQSEQAPGSELPALVKLGWKDGGGQDLVLEPAGAAGPTGGREGGISQSPACCSSLVWQFTSFICGLIVVVFLAPDLQPPHPACELPDILSINPPLMLRSRVSFCSLQPKIQIPRGRRGWRPVTCFSSHSIGSLWQCFLYVRGL